MGTEPDQPKYDRRVSDRWSLDRHIPIAVVVALLVQAFAWVWWIAVFSTETNTRLDQHDKRLEEIAPLPERLAALEALGKVQADLLRDIRAELRGRGGARSNDPP